MNDKKQNLTEETVMDILMSYKPKTTEELAEWLMMATRNLVDADGKRIYFKLDGVLALQIAIMMQAAKLVVPK
jgi:uncharacterized protein (UPF0216 family)